MNRRAILIVLIVLALDIVLVLSIVARDTVWAAVLFGIVSFGLMLSVWAGQRRAKRRHGEAMARLADQASFTHDPEAEAGDLFSREEWKGFALFRRPGSVLSDLIRRKASSGEVLLCGHTYVESSGRYGSRRRTQTLALFRRDGLDLPHFELHAERWYHQLGEKIGIRDIDAESHPKFSRHWWLRARRSRGRRAQPTEVRAMFSADLLAFFEELPRNQRWCVEGSGQWLLVWRDETLVEPDELTVFLDQATAIAARFQLMAPATISPQKELSQA